MGVPGYSIRATENPRVGSSILSLAIPHSPYSFRQVENVSGSRVRLDSLAAQSKNSIALEVLRSGSQARKITSARKDVILRALKAGLNLFSLPLSCDPHHLLYPKS